MSEPWWYPTQVVRIPPGGGDPRVLSSGRAVEYAPAVSPDGATVALTSLRGRTPWVVLSDPAGANRRPVAPGQFPVWNPRPRPAR